MALSTYLLYTLAVALLIVTPGPTMLMCVTNAINRGPRRAMTSVAGSVINRVCGGLFTVMGGLLLLTRRSA